MKMDDRLKSTITMYGNMTLREREAKNKNKKPVEEKIVDSDSSTRDSPAPKKRGRPFSKAKYNVKYDENGIDIETGKDCCDCLIEDCPGCWLPCPKCSSTKCGQDCRVFRKYRYESIEIEGTNGHAVIKRQK